MPFLSWYATIQMASLKYFHAIVPIYVFKTTKQLKAPGAMSMAQQDNRYFCTAQCGKVYALINNAVKIINDLAITHIEGQRNGLIGIIRSPTKTYLSYYNLNDELVVCAYKNYSNTFSQKTQIKCIPFKNNFAGKIVAFKENIYLAATDGAIWEINKQGSRVVAHGFVCPWSFSIDMTGKCWVGDDTATVGKVYVFDLLEIIDAHTIDPIFEYPYTDQTGSGIVGGFFDERYYYADRAGYLCALELRHGKYVQVANHKITSHQINGLYPGPDKQIYVCSSTGIIICQLKFKIRTG